MQKQYKQVGNPKKDKARQVTKMEDRCTETTYPILCIKNSNIPSQPVLGKQVYPHSHFHSTPTHSINQSSKYTDSHSSHSHYNSPNSSASPEAPYPTSPDQHYSRPRNLSNSPHYYRPWNPNPQTVCSVQIGDLRAAPVESVSNSAANARRRR